MFYDHERERGLDIFIDLHDIVSCFAVQGLLINTKKQVKYEFLITSPKKWSAELDKLIAQID